MVEQQTRTRETRQRRRKASSANTVGKKLAVNTDLLDFDTFRYRWINDAPARIFHLTKNDDWTPMTQTGSELKEDATDLGDVVSVVVGASQDGSPLRAYLCRKPRNWYEDDQKQKQTELDEQLESLRRGQSAKGEAQGDYVPNEGIKVA